MQYVSSKTRPKLVFVLFAVYSTLLSVSNAFAESSATGSADATMTVISGISILKTQDLSFTPAAPSSGAETIAPAGGTAAIFTVSGSPSANYSVTLPADGTVTMITGGGGANETIAVNTFTSTPAAGNNGVIGVGGSQSLRVGATRAALGAAQVTGSYTASFNVTVAYY